MSRDMNEREGMFLRRVRFESAALDGLDCEVQALRGEDELNRLFSFHVRLHVPGLAATKPLQHDLLDTAAAIAFEEAGREVARYDGIVVQATRAVMTEQDAARLSLTVVPRAWILTQTHRSEVFLRCSVPEIVAEKLSRAGLEEGQDFVLALRGSYPVREIVAQHAESDFDFIARLCEDLGIVFFFRQLDQRTVLILTDTLDTFEPEGRPRPEIRVGSRSDPRAAFDVARALCRVPERALVHDYNYRAPQLDVLAAEPTGTNVAEGGRFEYGVHAKTPEEAAHLARVRAEEIAATHDVTQARTTEMALRAGATFMLSDASGDERPLLATRVLHRSHLPGEAQDGGERTIHNEITAISAHVMYRPPRRTPRPRVPGLLHAVVEGDIKGPHAELDEAGRYRIRFRHDLSGRDGLASSHPVRMIQPHAGARYGMHFPLQPGIEVLIGCVEGDPDRPVIVGAVPNVETPSPVERANQTQNVLRTAAGNEIVMEDLAEQQRIRLHTPAAATTLQLGAANEPDEGVLAMTRANVTAAAARSINAATDRSVVLCRTSTALAGQSAVLLAGMEGLPAAADAGMNRLASAEQQRGAILGSLDRLASLAADAADMAPPADAAGATAQRWSDLAEDLSAQAQDAAARAVASMAAAADGHLNESLGRSAGEPLGPSVPPHAIVGSAATAALLARDRALVLGERAAGLCSQDTASVVGAALAELKSPARVDVAAGEAASFTSGAVVHVEAAAVRILGGYFPERETEPLDQMTSVGVLARKEIRLVSEEDCVLVCGRKNVLVNAHTGEMKLTAHQAATISAGSVAVRGGAVHVRAGGDLALDAKGDARIKAAGTIYIDGGTVEISGATIVLKGSVQIAGDLQVAGTVNGKRL